MNEFNTRIAESLGLTEDDLRSFVYCNPPRKTDLFTDPYRVRADGERSLTVKIFDDYIVCPRAGGKVEVDGYLYSSLEEAYQSMLFLPDYPEISKLIKD